MAEAAPKIGTAGLQGAVTTPREHAAIDAFRAAMAARRAEAKKPDIDAMIGAIEFEIAAREAGARAMLQINLAPSASALDALIALEGAAELLAMIRPYRAVVWGIIKPSLETPP